MVDANDAAFGAEEIREDVRQVAGAGADVENAGGGVEVGEEGFSGGGVHVRGGDCGAVADGLRRVLVGQLGSVVRAVDLGDSVSGKWMDGGARGYGVPGALRWRLVRR